jgi:hypothetical protein
MLLGALFHKGLLMQHSIDLGARDDPVRFRYRDHRGDVGEREVIPEAVNFTHARWFLRARSVVGSQSSWYVIDRIILWPEGNSLERTVLRLVRDGGATESDAARILGIDPIEARRRAGLPGYPDVDAEVRDAWAAIRAGMGRLAACAPASSRQVAAASRVVESARTAWGESEVGDRGPAPDAGHNLAAACRVIIREHLDLVTALSPAGSGRNWIDRLEAALKEYEATAH